MLQAVQIFMNKSIPKSKTVLGISLGTRYTGVAVFRHGELIEYQTKVFNGKITKKKLKRILNSLEKQIAYYTVDSIAMKIPEGEARSKEIRQIILDIEKIAKDKKLQFFRYTISDLKQTCFPDEKANRQDLAEYLMQKYPELSFVEKCGLNRHTYYGKMFEAVAAGMQHCIKP